ncbi:MAG: hypothetical protein HC902_02065 [Calothrix sp. SM1_5_4]|nr:hypothetical protein [Calothrix sp. SM1_5_4]
MDQLQVRYALLKISLLALVGSTWVFWSFIFASRPESRVMADEQDRGALTSLVRLPASLPAQLPSAIPGVFAFAPPAARAPDEARMDVVRVPCWDKEGLRQEAGARWIRLTGKACGGSYGADAVFVRNQANGYMATVFPTEDDGMTTDFIPLESGKNEILIRFDQGQGASLEYQLTLLR